MIGFYDSILKPVAHLVGIPEVMDQPLQSHEKYQVGNYWSQDMVWWN